MVYLSAFFGLIRNSDCWQNWQSKLLMFFIGMFAVVGVSVQAKTQEPSSQELAKTVSVADNVSQEPDRPRLRSQMRDMATVLKLAGSDNSPRLIEVIHSIELDDASLVNDARLLAQTWQALGLAAKRQITEESIGETVLLASNSTVQHTNVDATQYSQFIDDGSSMLDAAGVIKLINSLEPDQSYPALVGELRHLLQLAEHDWPQIEIVESVRGGDLFSQRDTLVFMLRSLNFMPDGAIASNETPRIGLENSSEASPQIQNPLYDDELVRVVKVFQQHHGLAQDGVLGVKTVKWLNMLPSERARRLAKGYVTKARETRALPASYVLVNIPAFTLELVEHGKSVLNSRVIVGKQSRQTPLISSEISAVVLNPSWRVPRRLVKQDVLPKVARDGGYIAHKGFIVTDYEGQEVHGSAEFYQQAALGAFPYRLEQRPGANNSLGRYKLHFANEDSIYLHDSPEKGLYGRANRALSSGCVRVEKIAQLADWLAQNRVTDPRRWQQTLAEPHVTRWFSMRATMPVRFVYWASWIDSDGKVQYRDDIYDLL